MSNRRPTVVKLDTLKPVSLHASMRVPEHDPIDAGDGVLGLRVQPAQQTKTGRALPMRRDRGRTVRSRRDHHVVNLAMELTGDRLVAPSPPVGIKTFRRSAPFDHIAVQE